MAAANVKETVKTFDDRREIVIPGNAQETVAFCAKQFVELAKEAIQKRGQFTVALSGGSTPHAIFALLSTPAYRNAVDWGKILFFWSDERCVPPGNTESNYGTALKAGLETLPIPVKNVFRMKGELDPEEAALEYEALLNEKIPSKALDLVMLGMGEDGHTASLFPYTHGLHTTDKWAIANYVPQKKTWRLSLTYECIHNARHICIYVMGKNKADIVKEVLEGPYDPDRLPSQRIGTSHHKALWILDKDAAQKLQLN